MAALAAAIFAYIQSSAQQSGDTALTIYFESNVFKIDSSQIQTIQHFLSSVATIVSVTGYADTVGSIASNLNLSKQRAFTVYALIQSLGTAVGNNPNFRGEEFQQSPELRNNRKVEISGNKRSTEMVHNNQKDAVIEVLELENVYFEPDKPIIVQRSIPFVNLLAHRLKSYKNVRFEIVGHVNYQSIKKGESVLQDLFRLSEQRAKVIHDILIDNGIPTDKLNYKGVGNSEPVIKDPKDDDERKKNMRVQVFVISYFPD